MMRPRITIHKGIRMLVAVDIGNTNIVLGFLDGDDIIGTYRITTKSNHVRRVRPDDHAVPRAERPASL